MTDMFEQTTFVTNLSEQALSECQQLLNSAKFNLRRNLYLAGKLTSISLLIQPDLEDTVCRVVQVLCHSAGQLRVDWDRVAIWMVEDSSGRNWFDVLDSRGRSRTFRVPYSASGTFGFVNPGDVHKIVEIGTVPIEVFQVQGGPSRENFSLAAVSTDRRLSAKVKMIPVDTLYVEVEARDELLRGSAVVFEIRSKRTGEILYSHEFQLRFREGLAGDWSVKDELKTISDEVDLFVYPVERKSS